MVLFAAEVQARRIIAGIDGMDERRRFYTIRAIKKIKDIVMPDFEQRLSLPALGPVSLGPVDIGSRI